MESVFILGSIALALMLGAMSPGPTSIYVAKNSIAISRQHGLFTALGTGLGAAIFGLLAVLGLQAFLLAVPSAYLALKICGGLYLLWLAFKIIKHAKDPIQADHAAGTGGTLAGLIEASQQHQQLLGVSALKGDFLTHEVAQLTTKRNWRILEDYCCGGYAKTTPELIQFIQAFEQRYNIPLEQVYTGKMLRGIFDLIDQDKIGPDQKILLIHTGGLQGRAF